MRSHRSQKESLVVARMLINIMHSSALLVGDGENVSHAMPDILLWAGIFIGETENRPMSPAKLAAYVGMPRGTVLRHVERMIQRGCVSPDKSAGLRLVRSDANMRRERATTVANMQHINKAFLALSKMDTPTIAAKPQLRLQNGNDAQTGNGKSST